LYKWIFAFVGFLILGRSFFGGAIGFAIGAFVDNYNTTAARLRSEGHDPRQSFSSEDIFQMYQRRTNTTSDFPTILMALSAVVMKADGKVLKAELDYVKKFFSQQFGNQFSTHHLQTLKEFLQGKEIPLERICQDIQIRLKPEVRLQLIHYLFGIAKADGHVSEVEVATIKRIASLLRVSSVEFESILNMFYRNAESDYKILGIEASATDEEIKKAYRKMAIKYHPDKVAQLGEEYQKGAKDKFQEVQNAYENLKKERNIK
jgi:DnaJ like chaperone protein